MSSGAAWAGAWLIALAVARPLAAATPQLPAPVVSRAAADTNRIRVGMAAPDFTLEDARGRPVTLSSYRGRLVVLVFYRGHW